MDESTETKINQYYASFDEGARLDSAFGLLEETRTRELIQRYLPRPPRDIVDIGGAAGSYAFWLASLGHAVRLIDLVPRHIERARARQANEATALASITVGDARALDLPDESADLIVLNGPLYHLPDHADRIQALRECHRVLRPGELSLVFAITRYAGVIAALREARVFDTEYLRMIRNELTTGIRENPPPGRTTFRQAYFHLPSELKQEVAAASLVPEPCVGVVGPVWLVPDLKAAWEDPARRSILLELARRLEHEPALSPHLLCVGRKAGAAHDRASSA